MADAERDFEHQALGVARAVTAKHGRVERIPRSGRKIAAERRSHLVANTKHSDPKNGTPTAGPAPLDLVYRGPEDYASRCVHGGQSERKGRAATGNQRAAVAVNCQQRKNQIQKACSQRTKGVPCRGPRPGRSTATAIDHCATKSAHRICHPAVR